MNMDYIYEAFLKSYRLLKALNSTIHLFAHR